MPKQKRPQLSKEQLATQMAMKDEADKFKKIIRESVYPALQKAKSIMHAQQACEIMKTVMMTKVNAYWADKHVSDLGLDEELTKDEKTPDRDLYVSLTEALSSLSITDAQKLLQGMVGALDGYARRLAAEKPMTEIPVEEIIAK